MKLKRKKNQKSSGLSKYFPKLGTGCLEVVFTVHCTVWEIWTFYLIFWWHNNFCSEHQSSSKNLSLRIDSMLNHASSLEKQNMRRDVDDGKINTNFIFYNSYFHIVWMTYITNCIWSKKEQPQKVKAYKFRLPVKQSQHCIIPFFVIIILFQRENLNNFL